MWDWRIDNSDPEQPVYLGEPEDTRAVAGPATTAPHPGGLPGDTFVGDRPVIRFNPVDGRPAFPLLRPHIGQRAPQSPNGHTGTPFLGPTTRRAEVDAATECPTPTRDTPDGLCPQNSPQRQLQHDAGRAPDPRSRAAVGGPTRPARCSSSTRTRRTSSTGTKPAVPLAIRVEHRRLRRRHARQRDDRHGRLRRRSPSPTCTSTTCSSTSRAPTARARATCSTSRCARTSSTDVQLTQDTAVGDTSIHVNERRQVPGGRLDRASGRARTTSRSARSRPSTALTLNLGEAAREDARRRTTGPAPSSTPSAGIPTSTSTTSSGTTTWTASTAGARASSAS